MTKHDITIERRGSGITECMTPVCSCGWRGIGYAAHNDYQHTLVRDQKNEHARQAARNALPTGDVR